MQKDEDFSDIPELGPADEDRVSNAKIPTLETRQPVEKPSQRDAAPVAKKKSNSPLLIIVVLLLAGGLGFSLFQQVNLQQQLALSEDILLQTQSRLADIESLVNATDESSSKTGAAFLAQLKRQQSDREARIAHVDDEIRKLWAIYQKYKPTIAELEKSSEQQGKTIVTQQKAIEGQEQALASQQKELKTVGGSLDTIGVSLNQQKAQLASLEGSAKKADEKLLADVAAIKDNLRLQNLQQQELNDLQQAEIAEIKAAVANAGKSQQLQAVVDEHQRSIDSINASRRQINAEILKLRSQLARLQSATSP